MAAIDRGRPPLRDSDSLVRDQVDPFKHSRADDLDLEDVVGCPHRGRVLSGPWEDHSPSCPAGGQGHSCRECDAAVEDFAKLRL